MTNTNQQAAVQVYKWIICAFSTASPIYKNQELFLLTIAKMFRTIYFYSYMEALEISEVKREEIAKIPEITAETEEKFNVSLPYLMRNHEWKILNYYICDAVESLKTGKPDPMEYFSQIGNAKILVWTYSAKLRFAFSFFAAVNIYQPFPLEEYIKDVTDEQKKALCSIITEMFEIPTIKLKSDFINDVRNIQKMLGKPFCLRADLVNEYNRFNNIIKGLNASEVKEVVIDSNTLKSDIEYHICNKWEFKAQTNIQDNPKCELTVTYMTKKDTKNHAVIIGDEIGEKLLDIISDRLPSIDIWYNQSGVQKLLDALKEHNFKYTNFKFIDDLAFGSDVRGSESFKELEKIINSIDFHDYFRDPKIFLVKDSINYSFTTAVPTPIALNGEQINYLLKSMKIADDMYMIDSATLNLQNAQGAVSQGYAFYSVNVSVSCDISDNDGLIINTLWPKGTTLA